MPCRVAGVKKDSSAIDNITAAGQILQVVWRNCSLRTRAWSINVARQILRFGITAPCNASLFGRQILCFDTNATHSWGEVVLQIFLVASMLWPNRIFAWVFWNGNNASVKALMLLANASTQLCQDEWLKLWPLTMFSELSSQGGSWVIDWLPHLKPGRPLWSSEARMAKLRKNSALPLGIWK